MNNIYPKGISFKKYLFTLIITSAVSTTAFAHGSFTGLGDLDGGIFLSSAHDVSNDGSVVVGYSHTGAKGGGGTEAFRWTQAEGMQKLKGYSGESAAYAISGDGLVAAGYDGSSPVYWGVEGYKDIGSQVREAGLDIPGKAFAINDDGTVILGFGAQRVSGYPNFTWMWTPDKSKIFTTFNAAGISGDGSTLIGNAKGNAFYQKISENGERVYLGDLFGGGTFSEVLDVNHDGSVIVGVSESSNGRELFRWDNATGMVGLGEGSRSSLSVSSDGSVIAGSSLINGEIENFVWTKETGRVAFEGLLDSASIDYSSFTSITSITGLSADGSTIVGNGINAAGSREAFIATVSAVPEPKSYAILLTGLGLLYFKLRKKKSGLNE